MWDDQEYAIVGQEQVLPVGVAPTQSDAAAVTFLRYTEDIGVVKGPQQPFMWQKFRNVTLWCALKVTQSPCSSPNVLRCSSEFVNVVFISNCHGSELTRNICTSGILRISHQLSWCLASSLVVLVLVCQASGCVHLKQCLRVVS